MKERPILFSGEMVRAILDGRKTQTRRVIKFKDGKAVLKLHEGEGVRGAVFEGHLVRCPYGKPGDRLWVRETFAYCPVDYRPGGIVYRSDGDDPHVASFEWHPSIHMFRKDSRILLEITDVRVQRVQDISKEDAVAEGLYRDKHGVSFSAPGVMYTNCYGDHWLSAKEYDDPREAFFDLWDSINSKRGYGRYYNPWVWAITFKVLKPE